ncbi:STAS domain-containing protein [Dyella acidiphila]|uniref:STAS domain-containing protein n=1 Tax=Dyella acidiphila TaxID=2775866 RepID=A0ABR9G622_9GAMM|nr:STAS domain-containing protein [Dyella acidiphila]MBE1159487.1 STAS domain-containing protein [Dyella acidiphila]
MGSKNKSDTPKGEVRVGMPADFRIGEVTDLHRQLRDALDGSAIVLDGGAVERVDTAALQLLVAFQHEARKRERALSWTAASAPLQDAAGQLGLAQILALPAKPA